MTTYKEIRGTNIEVLASDPSNPVLGQVWYNSTSDVVKAQSFNSGSWATSGNMDTGRRDLAGRAGFGDNKDSFVVASGNSTAEAEFWNGSSWTEVGTTAGSGQRINMGGGTTSAGIIGKCSGPTPQAKSTEEFNCDTAVLTVTTS